jgi:hypothetical protein
MLRFATTATTQRAGKLDLSSLTGQTNPVTGKPFDGQGRLFVSILGVAAASRQFWIGRLEDLYGITDGCGTRYSSATIRTISANRQSMIPVSCLSNAFAATLISAQK